MKRGEEEELTDAEEDEVYIDQISGGFCLDIRPKRWVIDGILPEGVTVLFGPSGVGKSFVALDMAFAVTTGRPWLDKYATRQQDVLYVSAEDTENHRFIAAEQKYGWDATQKEFHFKLGPIRLMEPQVVRRFHDRINGLDTRPGLIIIDTVAACMAGEDENSSAPMGRFIATINNLAAAFKASVLLVHHTGKDEGGMRGHSNFRSSVTATMKLTKANTRGREGQIAVPLVLTSDKAPRNGRPFGKLHLEQSEVSLVQPGEETRILNAENHDRSRVGLPPLDSLPSITSCVISEATTHEAAESDEAQPNVETQHHKDEPAFVALLAFGLEGTTYGKWEEAAGLKGGTFTRTKNRLIAAGRVRQDDKRYLAVLPEAVPIAA